MCGWFKTRFHAICESKVFPALSLNISKNLPKIKAKLMLCYEVGELNFRRSRRNEAMKKYGSVECLVPFCKEDDSLSHVQVCPGYTAKVKDGASPYEFIDYLAELELERNKRFNRSLINFKTL